MRYTLLPEKNILLGEGMVLRVKAHQLSSHNVVSVLDVSSYTEEAFGTKGRIMANRYALTNRR